uniref:PvLEA3 protein n=1 Tax=Polypedilum vanderplanki TaxID=319348 RepID=Q1XI24_POLVA|nr:PvLEA3 protein [Polypedilum vanderplanki]
MEKTLNEKTILQPKTVFNIDNFLGLFSLEAGGIFIGSVGLVWSIVQVFLHSASLLSMKYVDNFCPQWPKIFHYLTRFPQQAHQGIKNVTNMASEGYEVLKNKIPEGYEVLKDKLPDGYEALKDKIPETYETLKNKIPEGYEALKDKIPDGIKEAAQTAQETFMDTSGRVQEGIKEAAVKIKEGVRDASGRVQENLQDVTGKVQDKFNDVSGSIKDNLPNVAGRVQDKFNDVSGAIKDNLPDVAGRVKDNLSEVTGKVQDKFNDVSGSIKDNLPNVAGKVQEGYENIKNRAPETFHDAKNRLGDSYDDIKRRVGEKYYDVKDQAQGTFYDVKNKAGEKLQDVANEETCSEISKYSFGALMLFLIGANIVSIVAHYRLIKAVEESNASKLRLSLCYYKFFIGFKLVFLAILGVSSLYSEEMFYPAISLLVLLLIDIYIFNVLDTLSFVFSNTPHKTVLYTQQIIRKKEIYDEIPHNEDLEIEDKSK